MNPPDEDTRDILIVMHDDRRDPKSIITFLIPHSKVAELDQNIALFGKLGTIQEVLQEIVRTTEDNPTCLVDKPRELICKVGRACDELNETLQHYEGVFFYSRRLHSGLDPSRTQNVFRVFRVFDIAYHRRIFELVSFFERFYEGQMCPIGDVDTVYRPHLIMLPDTFLAVSKQ